MRTPPGPRRTVQRAVLVAVVAALLVTGCTSGGGGGGGGGNSDFTLYVLVVNRDESTESHILSYTGGAPLASSQDDETVESCAAAVVSYTVEVPFELLIDDVPVIISDELPDGVPHDGETDLIASIDILSDGTVTTPPADPPAGPPVAAGSGISKPAALGICG